MGLVGEDGDARARRSGTLTLCSSRNHRSVHIHLGLGQLGFLVSFNPTQTPIRRLLEGGHHDSAAVASGARAERAGGGTGLHDELAQVCARLRPVHNIRFSKRFKVSE
jgi:hypothetical protein